ncbi:F0F1 ATP synthase subunit delta [Methylocystis sp.]|uniref:F0F1 ATP synthase subunit delta n=1 Tax=Methylocystis sp. TaxID=1911079 RepID=UPI003D0F6E9E
MRIDWWTLALQTINALVLIWLLSRVLFKPVAEVIASRKATVRRLLDEAEAAKASAFAAQAQVETRLANMEAERSRVLTAAAAEAQTQKDAIVASARAEANDLLREARAHIEQETKIGRHAQMAAATKLATEIARRLLERLPYSVRVSGFFDGLRQAACALPPEAKTDFDRDETARLKAPRALTPGEMESCRQALQAAFGRPLVFDVEVDPSIIAGLELENRHTSIRNSLRADLARIAEELEKRDANDVS